MFDSSVHLLCQVVAWALWSRATVLRLPHQGVLKSRGRINGAVQRSLPVKLKLTVHQAVRRSPPAEVKETSDGEVDKSPPVQMNVVRTTPNYGDLDDVEDDSTSLIWCSKIY